MTDASPHQLNNQQELARKNKRTVLMVFTIVLVMIGLSFASVPLYRMVCKVLGWGGQANIASAPTGEVLNRAVTVRFNTDVNANLPWSFESESKPVTLKIGQQAVVSFKAKNNSSKPMAGTAIYDVIPTGAGKYLNKTQCFCFNYQMIGAGDTAHFPVVFYIDPKIANDPELDDLKTITLSYTFFRADSPELEKAMDAFYQSGAKGNKQIPIGKTNDR